MGKKEKKHKPIWLLAAFLAWLVPGLGHIYIGRARRGLILFFTIAAMFWSGIAIGGVMSVDVPYERWWFTAQAMTGIHGLVGWYRQEQVYTKLKGDEEVRDLAYPRQRPNWTPDKPVVIAPAPGGRPDELQMLVDKKLGEQGLVVATPTKGVALAYTGVAGMMNLLCIFDALMLALMGQFGEPKPKPETAGDKKEAKSC